MLQEEQRRHFFALVIGIKYEMLALGHMTPEIMNVLQADELYERSLVEQVSPFSWRGWILSIADAENSKLCEMHRLVEPSVQPLSKQCELCIFACQQCPSCLQYLWSQTVPLFPPA